MVRGLCARRADSHFDAGKGALAVFLAGRSQTIPCVAGMRRLRDCRPQLVHFLRFQGGKGVATTAGVFLGVAPYIALALFCVFLAVVVTTRYVSLGSIIAAATLPIWLMLFKFPWQALALGTLISVVTVVRHRSNIGRLLTGTEHRFGQKSR